MGIFKAGDGVDVGKLSQWQQQALKVYLDPKFPTAGPWPCSGDQHRLAKFYAAWVLFLDIRTREKEEAAEINARLGQASLTYHEPKKAFKSKWAEKHGSKHAGVRRLAGCRARSPTPRRPQLARGWPRAPRATRRRCRLLAHPYPCVRGTVHDSARV